MRFKEEVEFTSTNEQTTALRNIAGKNGCRVGKGGGKMVLKEIRRLLLGDRAGIQRWPKKGESGTNIKLRLTEMGNIPSRTITSSEDNKIQCGRKGREYTKN